MRHHAVPLAKIKLSSYCHLYNERCIWCALTIAILMLPHPKANTVGGSFRDKNHCRTPHHMAKSAAAPYRCLCWPCASVLCEPGWCLCTAAGALFLPFSLGWLSNWPKGSSLWEFHCRALVLLHNWERPATKKVSRMQGAGGWKGDLTLSPAAFCGSLERILHGGACLSAPSFCCIILP